MDVILRLLIYCLGLCLTEYDSINLSNIPSVLFKIFRFELFREVGTIDPIYLYFRRMQGGELE